MKALIQRVTSARVTVSGDEVGAINKGLLILLGVTHADTREIIEKGAFKVSELRIFQDDQGKMNHSLKDIQGSALVVSQFTLYGDTKKGRRPSFVNAADPSQAEPLYEHFIQTLQAFGIKTESGKFGSDMDVELVNSGPVTLLVES